MKKIAILSLVLIAVVAGCIGQADEEKVLTLKDGGRCILYTFNFDVHEISEIPIQDKLRIQELLFIAPRLNLLFDSNPEDNAGFALASFAITNKLTIYNIQVLGRFFDVVGFDTADESVTSSAEFINRTGLDIRLKGPNSGANATSVELGDQEIIVQGLDHQGMEMAGDRLALVVLEDLVDNTREQQLYEQRCQT